MTFSVPRLAHGRFITSVGKPTATLRQAQLAIVQLDDGTRVHAYVKSVPPRELTVEIVCALLLDSIALPGAQPIIVEMPGNGLRFGAKLVPVMPFSHALADNQPAAVQRLRLWPQLLPAAGFDEWIANPDRHHNNILHDGKRGFWLIDHGCAAGTDVRADTVYKNNILLDVACDGADAATLANTIKPRLRAAVYAFTVAALDVLRGEVADDALPDVDEVLGLLAARHAQLLRLIDQRLPQGQQDIFDGTRH